MREVNADSRGQLGTISKLNSVQELSFTGRTERFPISSFSKQSIAEEGIFPFAFSFVKRGMKNAFGFSKSELITFIVVILIWAGTGILKAMNIDIGILKHLTFFTGASSGLQGGALSISGGIAAKSFILAAIAGTIIPLFTNLFSGRIGTEFTGFKQFVSQFIKIKINNISHLAMLFIGASAAFIFYGFLSVNGSFQNNFVSILAAFLIIKNFGNQNSFFSGILSRAFRKTPMSGYGTSTVMTGMVLGYLLSIPVSLKLSNISGIGYIIGTFAVAAGVILLISGSSARKVEQTI